MENKFKLLNLDTLTRNDTLYPKEQIQYALRDEKLQNKLKIEDLKGEYSTPSYDNLQRYLVVEEDKNMPSLVWKELFIEDDLLYGVLQEKSYRELKEKGLLDKYEFTPRMLFVPLPTIRKGRRDKVVIKATHIRIIAIDATKCNSIPLDIKNRIPKKVESTKESKNNKNKK